MSQGVVVLVLAESASNSFKCVPSLGGHRVKVGVHVAEGTIGHDASKHGRRLVEFQRGEGLHASIERSDDIRAGARVQRVHDRFSQRGDRTTSIASAGPEWPDLAQRRTQNDAARTTSHHRDAFLETGQGSAWVGEEEGLPKAEERDGKS